MQWKGEYHTASKFVLAFILFSLVQLDVAIGNKMKINITPLLQNFKE